MPLPLSKLTLMAGFRFASLLVLPLFVCWIFLDWSGFGGRSSLLLDIIIQLLMYNVDARRIHNPRLQHADKFPLLIEATAETLAAGLDRREFTSVDLVNVNFFSIPPSLAVDSD
jgi:hypothetical protein